MDAETEIDIEDHRAIFDQHGTVTALTVDHFGPVTLGRQAAQQGRTGQCSVFGCERRHGPRAGADGLAAELLLEQDGFAGGDALETDVVTGFQLPHDPEVGGNNSGGTDEAS